ncbi:sodium:solute symporter family transporter [Myxosarcina sp. GI1(2024)]
MKFYTEKALNSLKVATVCYPIITLDLYIGPVFIGMWGHLAFPDLTGNAADEILPLMLEQYTSSWMASLVMVGAVAAFMSTLDSQLLALSSMVTRDVYTAYFRPQASLSEQIMVGRLLKIALALI